MNTQALADLVDSMLRYPLILETIHAFVETLPFSVRALEVNMLETWRKKLEIVN